MSALRLPRRRSARVLLAVATTILALVVVDVIALNSRLDEVAVAMPSTDDELDTWVIVGSDSRSDLADGTTSDQFGSAKDVPDARADLIVVVVQSPEGTRVISIPRDLLITSGGYPMRLGLTLLDGQQASIDALCTTLGIPADHYVQIGFDGFADVIDELGGISITLKRPMRDVVSGAQFGSAGQQTINGVEALALVRSRNAEELIDGQWVATAQGVADRASWAAVVFEQIALKARDSLANPVAVQQLAWTITGALQVDEGTGIFDLIGLDTKLDSVVSLPHDPPQVEPQPGQALPLPPNDSTFQTLAEAGFGDECTPG